MGGLVPGGTDSEYLQGWLLKFGEDRKRLRISVEIFVFWLASKSPPWEAYRAFISGGLISLNKCPGVFPVGIGGNWRRLFAKCVLRVTVPEASNECQDDQICAGLKAGINETLHRVQEIWYRNFPQKIGNSYSQVQRTCSIKLI